MRKIPILVLAVLSVIALTWLWHGPLGAGDRLAAQLEQAARAQLDRDEMTRVKATVARGPLSRRLMLSGQADDFQRAEIERRLEALPGVGDATWDPGSLPSEPVK
jgi:hypothetical protein